MKRMVIAVILALSMTTAIAEEQVTHDWSATNHIPHFGDIDGDGIDDLLLQAKTSDYNSEVMLSLSKQTVSLPHALVDNKLALADINGDGFYDLFVVYPDENMARTFLGSAQGVQTKDTLDYTIWWLGWRENTPDFDFSVGDFNGDGRDDIFVRAQQPDQPHYLIYAGKKKFKSAKRINAKLTGENWHSDEYSVGVGNVDGDKGAELVRFNNLPGGIDENGQEVAGFRFSSQANHSYSPSKAKAGTTQSLVGVPAAPSNYPGNGGNSYKQYSITYSIPFDSVAGATYYELYESSTDSNYARKYSGSGTSANFAHYNWGYQYYKYKACNSAGCSGLSPWRRIYVYAGATPTNPEVSPLNVATNVNYTVSWTPAGGAVDGAVYTLYESVNGAFETAVYSVTRQTWQETSYSFTTSKSAGGSYRYRVLVCNPQVSCNSSSTVYQTVIAPNSPPTANADSMTLNQNSSADINVLSNDWDPEGQALTPMVYNTPSYGSATVIGNIVRYTPNTGYYGTDSFTYWLRDSQGAYSGLAQVSLTINANMVPPSLTRVASAKMLDYTVQWTTVNGATRYELQEQTNSGSWLTAHNGLVNSMAFTQPIIANYNYRVKACNAANVCSGWSVVLPAMSLKNTYTANDVLGTPILRSDKNTTVEKTKYSYPYGQQENKQ
ncbi:MAG: VCBS repeat-containing protein [Algicola sp.]|nr:VCBS repeat-containing protein [Algicola sp.]